MDAMEGGKRHGADGVGIGSTISGRFALRSPTISTIFVVLCGTMVFSTITGAPEEEAAWRPR